MRLTISVTRALALVLALLLGPASAQMTLTGAGQSPKAAGASSATATYVGPIQTEATGGSTITYSSVPFGTASSKRVIAVVIGARVPAARTVSSVTVGGNAASQVASAGSGATNASMMTDIWYYADAGALGTSGTVIVTYSGTTTATAIQVYDVLTSTSTPTAGNNGQSTNTSPVSLPLTVPSNGVAIAAMSDQNGAAISFTNASLDNDGTISGGRGLAVGHTTSTGSLTISGAFGGSTNATLSLAAWGP